MGLEHVPHFLKGVVEWINDLKPLNRKKNPVGAFVVGILFGFPGIGLYLWSWKDFFISLTICALFVLILLPTVIGEFIGAPFGWMCAATYAAYRVNTSNEHL